MSKQARALEDQLRPQMPTRPPAAAAGWIGRRLRPGGSRAAGVSTQSVRWGGALLAAVVLGGCASLDRLASRQGPGPGPVYQPTNVFCAVPVLPDYLRRVAVLPISLREGDWEAEASRPALQEVLLAELGKAQRFEVVAVSADQVRDLGGPRTWRPEQPVPAELLRRLRGQLGCDGALFVHVQPFRAYPPLKLGWNLKLADLHHRQIIWAADEVFDASEAPVARAALQYARSHNAGADDASLVLTAPRRFAQYTLAALLARLPGH